MTTSYSQKRLRFTIELQPGEDGQPQFFAGTNSSKLVLTGLRARADVVSTGFIFPDASVKIWGVKEATMNQLPFFGVPNNPRAVAPAQLTIETSTSEEPAWLKLFVGQIVEAGPDYSAMPDVVLTIEARSLYLQSLRPVPSKQYPGTVDVAVIAQDIASAMDIRFENNGVMAQLTDPYLPSTYTAQVRKLVQDAGVSLYIDEKDNTLVLCNPGQPRQGRQAVLVSPQTGLVGYPTYDGVVGPVVQILYNPAIRIADAVQIQTGLTVAQSQVTADSVTKTKTITPNGHWLVYSMSTAVSSEMPNGPWFSTLKCSRFLVGATPQ